MACGRRTGGTRCTTRFAWSRWRCRCTRSGGRSPTGSTSRRGGRRGATSGRCSGRGWTMRSEEHTSELQSLAYLVCRLLLEKKKKKIEILHTVQEDYIIELATYT